MEKTVLITGASSGIGCELAKLFAKDGYHLVLVSRKSNQLDAVAGELRQNKAKVTVIPADLSLQGAAEHITEQLEREHITVDVLVNNAGFGAYGAFAELGSKTQLDEIQVNVVALTHLTRLVVPSMIERGSGRILNVASIAAFLPGPFSSIYYASKAFVLSFSEALASELQGTGVTVSVLCPGPTDTNFFRRAQMVPDGRLKMMSADEVARTGYRGLMKGQTVIIPGFLNSLGVALMRLLPKKLLLLIARKVQGK
ncbi:short-chain dehydrogenase [Candidatus Wirthbacteria bacterium CG2_30_54_11]|uniref:Short-chain dehydrogenase n=1 Tax=Candidatus Wirthbacteria bacterium CG2_30_54_11 TaxID=1817892 RepID=A0A1J5IJL6_9BACT|nr:MAG: short-chain dehydrogenase [Candidatus Wirthbacteria bacterium CG2_30_54_11]